jgi:hypothetical protein
LAVGVFAVDAGCGGEWFAVGAGHRLAVGSFDDDARVCGLVFFKFGQECGLDWLGCSKFPKCRGRGDFKKLPEPRAVFAWAEVAVGLALGAGDVWVG